MFYKKKLKKELNISKTEKPNIIKAKIITKYNYLVTIFSNICIFYLNALSFRKQYVKSM